MKIVSKKKIMKKSGFFGRLAPQRNNTASASHPLDRINREINILKKLDHPNIVKLVEDSLFSCNDFDCFVIEYCEVYMTKP